MIILDLIIVFIIFCFLYSKNEINFFNPSFFFLIFHIFFVSFRAYQILLEGSNIISNDWYIEYLTIDEISNALIVSDFTLLGFTLGFYLMNNKFILKGQKLANKYINYEEKNQYRVNLFIITATLVGFFSTISFLFLPGQTENLSDEKISIFVSLLTNLGVISALLIIYERGFKKIYLAYLFIILAIFAIQGYHRYRVILPLLFLMGCYLKINNLKFPPLKYILVGVVVLIFSFPLKQIGKSIQQKEAIDIVKIGENSFNEIINGDAGDLSFLEQSAAMIGTLEKQQKFFYGETYIPILYFWIPRDYWSDKPNLNQWQHDISTSGRDYGLMGQISLLSGESYANFRFFGAFFIPFILGRFYSKIYYLFKDINYKHKGFLLLLLFNMILFQVWRDGLISLIIFPLINYLPIVILILIKKPLIRYK